MTLGLYEQDTWTEHTYTHLEKVGRQAAVWSNGEDAFMTSTVHSRTYAISLFLSPLSSIPSRALPSPPAPSRNVSRADVCTSLQVSLRASPSLLPFVHDPLFTIFFLARREKERDGVLRPFFQAALEPCLERTRRGEYDRSNGTAAPQPSRISQRAQRRSPDAAYQE